MPRSDVRYFICWMEYVRPTWYTHRKIFVRKRAAESLLAALLESPGIHLPTIERNSPITELPVQSTAAAEPIEVNINSINAGAVGLRNLGQAVQQSVMSTDELRGALENRVMRVLNVPRKVFVGLPNRITTEDPNMLPVNLTSRTNPGWSISSSTLAEPHDGHNGIYDRVDTGSSSSN